MASPMFFQVAGLVSELFMAALKASTISREVSISVVKILISF